MSLRLLPSVGIAIEAGWPLPAIVSSMAIQAWPSFCDVGALSYDSPWSGTAVLSTFDAAAVDWAVHPAHVQNTPSGTVHMFQALSNIGLLKVIIFRASGNGLQSLPGAYSQPIAVGIGV